MSFSLAQRKELKETSTPSKASPYMGRMQKENCRNRQFSLGFGKAGRRLIFFKSRSFLVLPKCAWFYFLGVKVEIKG